jgi:hypothetical protein
MHSETEKRKSSDFLSFSISAIGGIVGISAMISVSYTQVLPLSYVGLALISSILSVFIGIINDDAKRSIYAMVIAVVGAVFLTIFMRAMPALLGIIPVETDLFIFGQVTTTLPIFFLIAPLCLLGNTLGILINEFLLKPQYAFQ